MPDADERDRIRKHFADAGEPGKAVHAERAYNELDNALAYGHEGDAQRARDELSALGYETRESRDRAEAAAARSEAAAARKAEKADKAADEPKAREPQSEPPQGRSATPPARQTTAKPGK